MTNDQLQTISPIDGRYIEKTKHLREYFSESALMRYRVLTEIKWLVFLSENDDLKQIPKLSNELKKQLDDIIGNFSIDDAKSIKTIEKETNHDVKAVEYFLQEKLSNLSGGKDLIPFIHFACTSEDINNISYAIMLKDACDSQCRELNLLQDKLRDYSHQWADDAMISRTHGQAASPTTMGKEFANFASRFDQQIKTLEGLEYRAKMNGETIPELIQNECNPKEIFNSVVYFLKNPSLMDKQINDISNTLYEIRSKTSSSEEASSILNKYLT